MLFAKGFVDWYKAKELADVVIITELQAKKSTKSRRTKSKDGHTKSSSTHIAKQEYYGHRIILSHHSKYFYQYFTKHQTSKEQSADERNSSSPTTSNNVDSCDVMSSEVLSGKSQMKASSTEDTDTGLLRLKIKFTNEKLFNFFPTENAFAAYSLANKLQIDPLRNATSTFISSLITRENAVQVLKMANEFEEEEEEMNSIKQLCITCIARNMQTCIDADLDLDLNWLPFPDFYAIVHHTNLAVDEEYTVYKIIKSYLKVNHLSAEQKRKLVSAIRLPYLKFTELETIIKEKIIPEDMLSEALIFRLSMFERPNREIKPEQLPICFQKRLVRGRLFEYKHDLDENGVIYYLSTNGRKSEWKNASLTGSIKVTASSIEKGKIHNVVDREPVECWTKEIPSSWFAIDLRQGKLQLTHYTLRHGGATKMDSLRNWVLQASHDGNEWTELSRHQNDCSLNGPFATHTWRVESPKPVAYRHFRILQTGHNSGNNNFLALSHIELYGEYFPNPSRNAAANSAVQEKRASTANQTMGT